MYLQNLCTVPGKYKSCERLSERCCVKVPFAWAPLINNRMPCCDAPEAGKKVAGACDDVITSEDQNRTLTSIMCRTVKYCVQLKVPANLVAMCQAQVAGWCTSLPHPPQTAAADKHAGHTPRVCKEHEPVVPPPMSCWSSWMLSACCRVYSRVTCLQSSYAQICHHF